jgi:hypothetical protein
VRVMMLYVQIDEIDVALAARGKAKEGLSRLVVMCVHAMCLSIVIAVLHRYANDATRAAGRQHAEDQLVRDVCWRVATTTRHIVGRHCRRAGASRAATGGVAGDRFGGNTGAVSSDNCCTQ